MMFDYLRLLAKEKAETYCMEILPGKNYLGSPIKCYNRIPLGKTMCDTCKTRKEKENEVLRDLPDSSK